MPFILSPLLWSSLSKPFSRKAQDRVRAHGDGMLISEDSPEAFEEVLWKRVFPGHYCEDHIELWDSRDSVSEGREHLLNFIQKLILLRGGTSILRYLSKNNGNIARLALFRSIFPNACILVPFRHPLEHSISMRIQHKNFEHKHGEDDFGKAYMNDIGHYEFSQLHRPLAFPGVREFMKRLSPSSIDYWLSYWISCFRQLSQEKDIIMVSYEKLSRSGEDGLRRICHTLGLTEDRATVSSVAQLIRHSPDSRKEKHSFSQHLTKEALDIYSHCENRCIL